MLRPCISHAAAIMNNSIDDQFRLISEAGFKCIDFNIDIFLPGRLIESGEFCELFDSDISTILEFFKPYKEAAKKYDLEFFQAHAPFQLYVDGRDDINEKCYDVIEKTLAICDYLDCRFVVVHPPVLSWLHDKEYEMKTDLEYYRRCIPFVKKYNVVICLENMFRTVQRHITEASCSDVSEAIYYIDTLNGEAGGEYFGFCFDLGHMNLLGKNVKENLIKLGKRIKLLHIHDNDGIQDHHAIPFSYSRNWGQNLVTDWNGFIEGLKAIGFTNDVDFEVGAGCTVVPKELRSAVLKYVYEIANYFCEKIKQ